MSSATAVLLSAGLDSAVLAASEARSARVHPIYVSAGLAWERTELDVAGKQAFFGTPTDAAGSLMRTLAESRFAEDQSSQVRQPH